MAEVSDQVRLDSSEDWPTWYDHLKTQTLGDNGVWKYVDPDGVDAPAEPSKPDKDRWSDWHERQRYKDDHAQYRRYVDRLDNLRGWVIATVNPMWLPPDISGDMRAVVTTLRERLESPEERARRLEYSNSAVSSTPKAQVVSVELLDNRDARWLNLVKIQYRNIDGKLRTWEAMSRKTKPKGSAVVGVQIIAVLEGGSDATGGAKVLLEKQFRPPADKVVVEFPAGLIDEGETLEQCALRELREETGYIGEVIPDSTRPAMFSSPAASSSATFMVKVKIEASRPENQNPQTELEDNEFIECFWVPLRELYAECRRLEAQGFAIDGKVGAFAEGVEMSRVSSQGFLFGISDLE